MDDKRTRIVWTDEDKEKLSQASAEIVRQRLSHQPKKKFLAVLREAQEKVLPPERHRKIATISWFQDIKDRADVIIASPLQEPAEPSENSESEPESPETSAQEESPTQKIPEGTQMVRREDVKSLVEELFFELVEPIVESIVVDVESKIATTLQNSVSSAVAAFLSAEGKIEKKSEKKLSNGDKKNVLIVGLLDKQAQEVKAEYGNRFNLTFFDSQKNGSGKQLQGMVKNKDLVLANTMFTKHAKLTSIHGFSKGRVIRYYGGVGKVRNLLDAEWKAQSSK